MSHDAIENLSHEDRSFAPSAEFAAQANATAALYDEAAADRLAFWERQAGELEWETPWTTVRSVGMGIAFSGTSFGSASVKTSLAVACTAIQLEASSPGRRSS